MNKLGHWPHRLAEYFREDFRASLFSATLVVIIASLGYLGIFTKLSLLLVANQAAQPQALATAQRAADAPLVVLLSERRWQERYLERSPLDRCLLAEDLEALLRRSPKTLLVDFDLSPMLGDSAPHCQQRLDALLDRHAGALVLLAPIKVASAGLLELKTAWMRARCQGGIAFGRGDLEESLGIVIDASEDANSMAGAVHERSASTICQEIDSAAGAARWLKKDADANQAAAGEDGEAAPDEAGAAHGEAHQAAHEAAHEAEVLPINFSAFRQQALVLAIDDERLAQVGDWSRRHVYFGGDYGGGKDDVFLTPLGQLAGVTIHAARVWSLAHPVKEIAHGWGFLSDIMIAFIFSLGIKLFWHGYVACQVQRLGFRREFGAAWVCGFVLFYAGLVWAFFLLATQMFALGLLIAPLLIAISMLVDGFVTGPISTTLEAVKLPRQRHLIASQFPATLVLLALLWGLPQLVHASVPLVLALAGAAVLLDRVLSTMLAGAAEEPAEPEEHEEHGHAQGGWRWPLLALQLLLAGAVSWLLLERAGLQPALSFTALFLDLLCAFSLLLLVGLVLGLAGEARTVRLAAPPPQAGVSAALRWFGVLGPLRGAAERIGLGLYLARLYVFWVVVVWAIFLMNSH